MNPILAQLIAAAIFRHGADYTLSISQITMPNALGKGFHSEHMLERRWNKDENGSSAIDTIHIGLEHECREMMQDEMEEGLTVGWP